MKRRLSSLRRQLFVLCIFIVAVMGLLCGYVLLNDYHSIRALTYSLRSSTSFNNFYAGLTEFQQAFSVYANSLNRNDLNDCYLLLDRLDESSLAMAQEFPDVDIIQKNRWLIELYDQEAQALLNEAASLPEPTFWNRYDILCARLSEIDSNARQIHVFFLQKNALQSQRVTQRWELQFRLSMLILIICTVVLLLFTHRFLRNLISPIQLLANWARCIAEGDLSQRPEADARRHSVEIEQLYRAFSCMADTIRAQMNALKDQIEMAERLHTLELENVHYQLSLAEKEVALMQSMANPHFLFNCLGTVSSMAVLEDAPGTRDIANRIARYLRSSIELVGSRIPMADELELLKQYLYIQSVRFGDRISCHCECAPECADVLVPAMVLQPIVENSILHGFQNRLQGGYIEVKASPVPNGKICICISDNGCGMAQAALEQLLKRIREPFCSGHECVGLHSTYSQFANLFKGDFSFSMENAPGGGMRTRILIPMRLPDVLPSGSA